MDLFGEEEPVTTQEAVAFDPVAIQEDLEQFTHPRCMQFCLGHSAVEEKLLESYNQNRLAHGLILSGPKGIGKATLAYRFAKFLLKQTIQDPNQNAMFAEETGPAPTNLDVGLNDPAVRLVNSSGHPDLMTVERAYDASKDKYKSNVDVAEIRKVAPFLRMTASGGGWRVVIIDDADTMNRNAQNALLKILEEPPKNTVLILVTHNLGRLIPTIRSRTQLINVPALSEDTMEDLIHRKGLELNQDQLKTLVNMANGSFGKLLDDVEGGGLETLETIIAAFDNHPNWNWPEIHKLADTLARNGQDQAYKNFQNLLQWVFSEITLSKARGHGLQNAALDIEAFRALQNNSSLEQLLKICENLSSHFKRADAVNLDKRQAVLGAFSLITA